MQYFSQTFTQKTWHAFLNAGAKQTGFNASMRTRAAALLPGDRILCYLKGEFVWIGALEAASIAHGGGDPIWGEGGFPVRVDVRPAVLLDREDALPVAELEGHLSFFPTGRSLTLVPQRLQGSPQRLQPDDGERIFRALVAREDGVRARLRSAPEPSEPAPEEQPARRVHSEMQATLADLGLKMDCDVWVPRADQSALERSTPGFSVKRLLLDLPPIFGGHADDTVRNIDVIWFHGHRVVAAFEVENTTAIYSGLLRMADLVSLVPNIAFPLYIVADDARRADVRREILRPAFQYSKLPLERACGFLSYRVIRDLRSRYTEAQLKRLDAKHLDVEAEYFTRDA